MAPLTDRLGRHLMKPRQRPAAAAVDQVVEESEERENTARAPSSTHRPAKTMLERPLLAVP